MELGVTRIERRGDQRHGDRERAVRVGFPLVRGLLLLPWNVL